MTTLLPCPFCKGTVHVCGTEVHDETGEDIHECHHITCQICGDFDLSFGLKDIEDLSLLRTAVIARWNTRP